MTVRKLNFKKCKMHDDSEGTDIIHPIDEQTGEEIAGVIACSVKSSDREITTMTLTVQIV